MTKRIADVLIVSCLSVLIESFTGKTGVRYTNNHAFYRLACSKSVNQRLASGMPSGQYDTRMWIEAAAQRGGRLERTPTIKDLNLNSADVSEGT